MLCALGARSPGYIRCIVIKMLIGRIAVNYINYSFAVFCDPVYRLSHTADIV